MDEAQLRDLIPGVLAALVHRGADFATAEDAVQEALLRAVEMWPKQRPDDPKGWLIATAWRRFIDLTRSDMARRRREGLVSDEPPPGPHFWRRGPSGERARNHPQPSCRCG